MQSYRFYLNYQLLNPEKTEPKKQSRKHEKEYYFVLSNFRVFVVKIRLWRIYKMQKK